jgi:DNA-binding ferritin-like protein (Dps family)
MISSKQLISENNEKRKLLTKENEKYYDDILVYIRIKSKASEQESEEILMELLDHLIEGQQDGKKAADIFGDDPKGYADELISELPKETFRTRLPFFGLLAGTFILWALIGRGLFFLIVGFFTTVDTKVYLGTVLTVTLYWLIFGILMIWFIFRCVERSLFTKKRTFLKQAIIAGIVAALGATPGFILIFFHFLPNFGPSFSFGWLPSLVSGAFLWLITFWAKKKTTIS